MAGLGGIRIAVYEDLAAIERDWRAFEQIADGTVFQTFDWLSTWQRHIGARNGVRPAIVVGRDASGAILFLLPLAVCTRGSGARAHLARFRALRLQRAAAGAGFFRAGRPRALSGVVGGDHAARCRTNPRLHFDLDQSDQDAGNESARSQIRCGTWAARSTPSGAYLTHLTGDWETFYAAKRSSATRRRDRTKRKKLSEFGEITLVNPADDGEMLHTLDILMAQKARSFAHMGVGNLFAKPGYAEFYRAIAADPATTASGACEPARRRRDRRRGQSRTDLSRLLLSLAGELRRRRRVALRAGRRASARSAALGHRPRLQRLRFHHRRRALQARLVRHRAEALRLYRGGDLARRADRNAAAGGKQRLKRWIKQTPAVWNAFSAVRALYRLAIARVRR